MKQLKILPTRSSWPIESFILAPPIVKRLQWFLASTDERNPTEEKKLLHIRQILTSIFLYLYTLSEKALFTGRCYQSSDSNGMAPCRLLK
jgi:hypothetical protein